MNRWYLAIGNFLLENQVKRFEFRQKFLMKNHPDELNPIQKVMDELNELGDSGWQVTAMSESKTRIMIMLQREKAD